jgi:ornithine carbamoyltransferase
MKHLLSIESLHRQEIYEILELADSMKGTRGHHDSLPLAGQCWALIFSKSSTRTRVSFEVGIRELGGSVMFLSAADIQLGRGEPIEDTARVMGRLLDGAVIRTFRQSDVEVFAEYAQIPTINALTDDEHPCQILADLQTIREKLGGVEGRSVCFIGDGACNVAASWLWAAAKLDFELRIAAPAAFQPSPDLLERLGRQARIVLLEDPMEAAKGADVLYTDVWVSMGKEEEAAQRLSALAPYQINETLLTQAAPKALVMHCLPAYRGKEISAETFELHADTLFDQAENRLHAQKAVLQLIAGKR